MATGKTNGIALGAVAVGGVFAWSGLFNKKFSQTIQSLIKGEKPSPGPKQNIVPASAGTITNASGQTIVTPAGPGEAAWFAALCLSIAAPPTKANISSLEAWASKESPWNAQPPDGAQYTHNPLNTTLAQGSIGSVNSVGVKIYATAAGGVAATAATLLGGYPGIVSALRSGKGLCGGGLADDFSKWSGSGGYSSVC